MQEEITLELPKEFITAILALDNKTDLLLIELRRKELSIEELLNRYHYEEKGKAFDYNIEKDSVQFNGDLSGSFTANYSVNYTNGCQDLIFNEKDQKLIQFTIDLKEETIRLVGEYIPERLPDEF